MAIFLRQSRYLALIGCLLMILSCSKGEAPALSIEVASRGVLGAAFSADGKAAIVGSVNHGASLWRTSDAERLFNWNHNQGEPSTILSASISPDGRWALTAEAHTLVLWNVASGEAARFWTAPGEVLDVALGPNGNYALLGLEDHSAVIFDVKRGGIVRTFTHQNRVRSVAFSADGQVAMTGSEDNTAVVWDVRSGKPIHTIKHSEEVQLVALSDDGKLALSAAKYDKATLWNVTKKSAIGSIPLAAQKLKRGLRLTSARFSSDKRYLLTGLPDQRVQLWRIPKLTLVKQWELPKRHRWRPTSAGASAVAFSTKSGRYYTIASNGFIHVLR